MTNIVGLNGKTIKPPEEKPVYNLRVCLIGSDDLDIKRVETFGVPTSANPCQADLINFRRF